MSVESLIGKDEVLWGNKENTPKANTKPIGSNLARREKGDTASAVKKRIRAQQSAVDEGGSLFSTSPGTFLKGGGPMSKKQKV